MSITRLAGSCVLVALFGASLGAAEPTKVEQDLIALDKEWGAAETRGDIAALERIMGDDYTYTDASGRSGDKRQFISDLKAKAKTQSESGHGEFETDNYRVQVYGTTAVMTHRVVEKGKNYVDEKQAMHVWVQRDGRWQVVAHQWTPVAFPQMPKVPFLNQRCAKNSFQPEILSYFGDSETIISKLDRDQMGLQDRRGYFLLIETRESSELVMFQRVDDENMQVAQWHGATLGDLRERLTDAILANRGIACIGEQSKAIVLARFSPEDKGVIPEPVSPRAAFSHFLRHYNNGEYLRVTLCLLC